MLLTLSSHFGGMSGVLVFFIYRTIRLPQCSLELFFPPRDFYHIILYPILLFAFVKVCMSKKIHAYCKNKKKVQR